MDYFGSPSLGSQDVLLKKHPCLAASVGDDGQAPPTAFVVADDVEDDGDWDLEGAVGLDDIEQAGSKRHQCQFQDSCRSKK